MARPAPGSPRPPDSTASPSATEILEWIAWGLSNAAIAEGPFVSEATVKAHVGRWARASDATGLNRSCSKDYRLLPMRIFLAGATGVIGVRLVPLLSQAGHVVAGMTRTPTNAPLIEELGAEPVVGNVFDREWIMGVVRSFQPDVVMHQLTDLPDDVTQIGDFIAANALMRREGTSNLLEATRQSGTRHLLVQSVAWELPGEGGRAVKEMEANVLEFGGTVLRYGQFYGPGTYHTSTPPPAPRIHIDEAARRTVSSLGTPHGVVEIVEDSEPLDGYVVQ